VNQTDDLPFILNSRPRAIFLLKGESMPLRMRVHEREAIGAALRRFKKLLERSGVTKELRRCAYYEKPCEVRRRAKLRKLSAIRKGKLLGR
jgi:small subunit ribosomal protein S21